MSKTYEETLSFLSTVEGGEEYLDAVKGKISKVNTEAQTLRTRAKEAESKVVKLNKVVTAFELDGIDDDEVLDAKIKDLKTKQMNTTSPAAYKALQKRLEKIEAERDDERKNARKSKVDSELSRILHDSKVVENVFGGLKDVLANKVKFNDDGSHYYDSNGEQVTLDDGVKSYLAENPGFVKNEQNGGTGGSGGTGQGKKEMKRSEWQMLEPRARAEHLKDGTIVD